MEIEGANWKEEKGQWEWDGTRQGDRGEYDRNNLYPWLRMSQYNLMSRL